MSARAPSHGELSLVPSGDDLPPASGPQGEELVVRISANGRIEFSGSRADIEAFLQECAAAGLILDIEFLSWCG